MANLHLEWVSDVREGGESLEEVNRLREGLELVRGGKLTIAALLGGTAPGRAPVAPSRRNDTRPPASEPEPEVAPAVAPANIEAVRAMLESVDQAVAGYSGDRDSLRAELIRAHLAAPDAAEPERGRSYTIDELIACADAADAQVRR